MNNFKAPRNIPIGKLRPFEGHPFKVKDDDEMNSLIESVQMQGIMAPLIVRPIEDTSDEYEVISGHRRLHAAQKAGLETVPAFVYALDHDAAAIALVDSNLHREHILPSEKAFAYKLKYEALRHQGASCQVGTKLRSDELMAETADESARQIQRYIRLTKLLPEILEYVDNGRMSLTPAAELSYLTVPEQHNLLEDMRSEDCTPSLSQACRLKKLSQDGLLTPEELAEILCEEKANQKEKLRIPMERIRGFFPKDYTTAQIEDSIIKFCETQYRKKQRDRDAR